ncbi:prepilin peptidase [Simplicispira lacusdiani]|uniref:prepilin peptidase n=1 Tax=Simplicispira lacusdiani TaxID=2213010 RepID=UPI000E754C0F|nr:A24 family peptidase [Simplicispira lacusdiani]
MEFAPWWDAALAGVMGLLVGSFLNVVIYRLPKMMERQWAAECMEYTRAAGLPVPEAADTSVFNLAQPRSRCQACGHQLRWYENIPVLSYLFLRGRCSSCSVHISMRYPLVELATAALFYFCVQRWGTTPTGLAWCLFSATLLVLALIDWDTTLLPDDLTLPLLWAGLLASALHWIDVPLFSAVVGAAAGYVSLWLVYWGFKLATGKEGMGYGDFKLFAALGAWFGWQALVPLILMASVVGAIIGIAMKFSSNLREGGYVPFGPFLVGAGLLAMAFGPQRILQTLLGALGL